MEKSDLWIQIADKDVGPNIQVLLVRRGFVHPHWLPKQFYHVHDLDRVVCVIFAQEFHKAVSLMLHRDTILGHVDIDNWASLGKMRFL